MSDYYEILGVSKQATPDELKKAFRKKAHELHPDKGGDAEAFKRLNEAYQVLGDAQKRAQYDRFGHAAFQQGGPGPGAGFGGFDFQGANINMDDLGDLGDMLGNMFGFGGQAGAGSARRRGRDIEVNVTIDFLEAVRGVVQEVSLRALTACEDCTGTGAKGGKLLTCKACEGRGRVARAQRTPFGMIQTAVLCSACQGTGKKPETPCETCAGAGVYGQTRKLPLQIPAGIGDGETIRVSGAGEAAAHGGVSGDLYVHVRVRTHARFRRDGQDIRSNREVPVSMLLLGGMVTVETVDGPGDLHIPPGTPAGTVFKLRGYGFPFLHGHGRGDHLVTVMPDISKKLTKEQKKILEDLKSTGM